MVVGEESGIDAVVVAASVAVVLGCWPCIFADVAAGVGVGCVRESFGGRLGCSAAADVERGPLVGLLVLVAVVGVVMNRVETLGLFFPSNLDKWELASHRW